MIKTQQSIMSNDVASQGDHTQMMIDEEEINVRKRKFEVEKTSATPPRERKSMKRSDVTAPSTPSQSRLFIDVSRTLPIPEDQMTPNTRKKYRSLFISHSEKIDEFADDTRESLEPRVGDEFQAVDQDDTYNISASSYGTLLESQSPEIVSKFDAAYFHPGRLVEAWCEKRHCRFDAIVTRSPLTSKEQGYDVAFRDGTRATNLTLEQIGGSRKLWTTPNVIRRKSGRSRRSANNTNSRDFASMLHSNAKLRVAAEVAMLLRNTRKHLASKHFEKCVKIALSPLSIHDEIDLKTLFTIIFGAAWTEVEIHRFKVLLHHHGEGKWDKISRDMIPCYDRDGKGHVKTPEQCSQFFFLNSYSQLSHKRRRVKRGGPKTLECSCCREKCRTKVPSKRIKGLGERCDDEKDDNETVEDQIMNVIEDVITKVLGEEEEEEEEEEKEEKLLAVSCMLNCGRGLCCHCVRERGDWTVSSTGKFMWICDSEECDSFRKWALSAREGTETYSKRSQKQLKRMAIAQTKCEVCESDKDDERMLLCDNCDDGYHIYCLTPSLEAIPKTSWSCPRCSNDFDAVCDICKRGDDEYHMLLCDGCYKGFHLGCLKPKMELFPCGERWYCQTCEKKRLLHRSDRV